MIKAIIILWGFWYIIQVLFALMRLLINDADFITPFFTRQEFYDRLSPFWLLTVIKSRIEELQ